jgi:hypothetical protein
MPSEKRGIVRVAFVEGPEGLGRWLPGLVLVRRHRGAALRRDVAAGVVLAALLVPQGMAYAELQAQRVVGVRDGADEDGRQEAGRRGGHEQGEGSDWMAAGSAEGEQPAEGVADQDRGFAVLFEAAVDFRVDGAEASAVSIVVFELGTSSPTRRIPAMDRLLLQSPSARRTRVPLPMVVATPTAPAQATRVGDSVGRDLLNEPGEVVPSCLRFSAFRRLYLEAP